MSYIIDESYIWVIRYDVIRLVQGVIRERGAWNRGESVFPADGQSTAANADSEVGLDAGKTEINRSSDESPNDLSS